MNKFETLLRRVWDEYGKRGDLPAKLLMEIEDALQIEKYTCGCEVLQDKDSFAAYCPKHNKPIAVKTHRA